MRNLDRVKIADIFRNKRKELRLKLEDLADETISIATLSNIERAISNVTVEKIEYCGTKLGYNKSDLPELPFDNSIEIEDLEFDLFSIESTYRLEPNESLQKLSNMNLKKDHPLSYMFYFLLGKCHFRLKNHSEAEKNFLEAIHILTYESPQLKKTNIISASFYELSRSRYYKNDLKQALKYIQDGLNQFVDDGDRLYYKQYLLTGKSVYLEKLGHIEESIQDIEYLRTKMNLFKNEAILTSNEVTLLVYEQRSKILKKFKMLDDAIECVKEGIHVAVINKSYDRELDLWTLLGCMYAESEKLTLAEKCFLTALQLKEKIQKRKEYLFVSTYTQLGKLYSEKENWKEAQENLEEAVRVGEKTNDVIRYIKALTVLGDCFSKQQLHSKAIIYYKKAIKQATIHGFLKLEPEIQHKLGICYKKTGDLSSHKRCVDRFFEIGLQLEGRWE